MTKRYETIDLFGKRFTLDTKETIGYQSVPYRTIYDVYSKPSATKVEIYKSWQNWFDAHGGYADVCSHNSNFFSIQGYVHDYDNRKLYYCRITHANNYCIEVE